MICKLCLGMQYLLCLQPSHGGSVDPKTKKWSPDSVHREWYNCPGCGATGVRSQAGPETIRMHTMKSRKGKNVA